MSKLSDISPEEIDFAISVLTRLKGSRSDTVESLEFWQFEHPRQVQSSIFSNSEKVTPSATDALYTLRRGLTRFRRAFEPVWTSLDAIMVDDTIFPKDRTPRRGVCQLPDEVLASIFRWASETEHFGPSKERTSMYKVMRLSHVCRHFRRITISQWSLWATLDTRVPFKILSAFIPRAGSSLFTVVLIDRINNPHTSQNEVEMALSLILQFDFRWRDIFIRLNSWTGPLANRLKQTVDLDVSSLRYFCFSAELPLKKQCPSEERHNDFAKLPRALSLCTWQFPATTRIEQEDSAKAKILPYLLDTTFLSVNLKDQYAFSRLENEVYQLHRVSALKIHCVVPSSLKTPNNDRTRPVARCLKSRADYLTKLTDLSFDVVSHDSPDASNSNDASTGYPGQVYFTDVFNLLPGWRLSTFSFSCDTVVIFQNLLACMGVWEGLEKLVLHVKLAHPWDRTKHRFKGLEMDKWCPVMPNLKSITFEGDLPELHQWLDSRDGFVLGQLTGLYEIVFKDSCRSFDDPPLIFSSGEVVAKAWTATLGSSLRKDIVFWNCRGFDALFLKHLRHLGLNVTWK